MSLIKKMQQALAQASNKKIVIKLLHGGFVRSFGWKKTKNMPLEGLVYIYEELPHTQEEKILAYCDIYGRIFLTSKILSRSLDQAADIEFKPHEIYRDEGSLEVLNQAGSYQRLGSYQKQKGKIKLFGEAFDGLGHAAQGFITKEDAACIALIGLLPEFRNIVDAQESNTSSKETPGLEYLNEVLQSERSVKEIVDILENFNRNVEVRKKLGKTNVKYPSGAELYVYRLIGEHDLLKPYMPADELQTKMALSKIERTNLYYLVFLSNEISSELRLWGLSLESVINRMNLAQQATREVNPSEEKLAQIDFDLIESFALQSPTFDAQNKIYDRNNDPYAAWNVRVHMAEILESLKLPFRLETDFRINKTLDRGLIHFRAPEIELLPRVRYSQTLKTWLAQTEVEKQVQQSRYVARLSSVIASVFFAANPYAENLLIQAELIKDKKEAALASFNLNRKSFAKQKMLAHHSPFKFINTFAYNTHFEHKVFYPQQTLTSLSDPAYFDLDSFNAVERLEQNIPKIYQQDLFASNTKELAIVEGINRLKFALDLIYTDLGTSTTEKIDALFELKKSYSDDKDLNEAVERTAAAIIDGTLENAPSFELAQYILAGSDLALSYMHATFLFSQGLVSDAYQYLKEALDMFEQDEPYRETDQIRYQYFTNYFERILFNKLTQSDTRDVQLVPDTYFESYMLAAACLIELKEYSQAEEVLLRAQALAPLNGRVANELAQVYSYQGKDTAAFRCLTNYLEHGFIPQEIGTAYYRLAHLLNKQQDTRTALVCYTLSGQIPSSVLQKAQAEFEEILENNPAYENFDFEGEQTRLQSHDIPLAPNTLLLQEMEKAAIACVSLQYFAPAYQMINMVGPLTGNDALYLVQQSLGMPQ